MSSSTILPRPYPQRSTTRSKRRNDEELPGHSDKKTARLELIPIDLTEESDPPPMSSQLSRASERADEDRLMPQSVGKVLEHVMERCKRDEMVKQRLQDRCTELETIVKMERKQWRIDYDNLMCSYEDKVIQSQAYATAMTKQPLDATVGICNLCGRIVPEGSKVWIMEQCGAPVCDYCRQQDDLQCPVHPLETGQNCHQLYSQACAVCSESDPKKLIDAACGHPICRVCQRQWAAQKKGISVEDLDDEDTSRIRCVVCKKPEELWMIMQQPSLKHEDKKKRQRAIWPL